jgi:hypothetical protein
MRRAAPCSSPSPPTPALAFHMASAAQQKPKISVGCTLPITLLQYTSIIDQSSAKPPALAPAAPSPSSDQVFSNRIHPMSPEPSCGLCRRPLRQTHAQLCKMFLNKLINQAQCLLLLSPPACSGDAGGHKRAVPVAAVARVLVVRLPVLRATAAAIVGV